MAAAYSTDQKNQLGKGKSWLKKMGTLAWPGFTIGKIARSNNRFLLLDRFRPACLLVDEHCAVIQHSQLPEVAIIDAVTPYADGFLITDSQRGKILFYRLVAKGSALSCLWIQDLPAYSQVAAIAEWSGGIAILDKAHCLIRLRDDQGQEIKTIGGRLSYVNGRVGQQRLGFEYPEDLVPADATWLLVDAGNCRIVVLDRDWHSIGEWETPEFPQRILGWSKQLLAISSFSKKIMLLSPEHGFLDWLDNDIPLDFSTIFLRKNVAWVASEGNDLYEFHLPQYSPLTLARRGQCLDIELKLLWRRGEQSKVRRLVKKYPSLIETYGELAKDEFYFSTYPVWLHEQLRISITEIEQLQTEIMPLAESYLTLHNWIPFSNDPEADCIKKEIIGQEIFSKLGTFRHLLQALYRWRKQSENFPAAATFWQEKWEQLQNEINKGNQTMTELLGREGEPSWGRSLTCFWLAWEKATILFPEIERAVLPLPLEGFLLEMLDDFYFCIAQVYAKQEKKEKFCQWAARELQLYPEKTQLLPGIVYQLLHWQQFAAAQDWLKRYLAKDKENYNFLLYKIYRAQNDMNSAYQCIKKELALFPHKNELIAEMIEVSDSQAEDWQANLEVILHNADQSIDLYFHVAKSLWNLGDYEKARHYLDMELQRFPENQKAILFKLETLLDRSLDRVKIKTIADQLSWRDRRTMLIRAQAYFFLAEYECCWDLLNELIRQWPAREVATAYLYLLGCLNYLGPTSQSQELIFNLSNGIVNKEFQQELAAFLSLTQVDELRPESLYSYSTQTHSALERMEQSRLSLVKGDVQKATALMDDLFLYQCGNPVILSQVKNLTKDLSSLDSRCGIGVESFCEFAKPPQWTASAAGRTIWVAVPNRRGTSFLKVNAQAEILLQFAAPGIHCRSFGIYDGNLLCADNQHIKLLSPTGELLNDIILSSATDHRDRYREFLWVEELQGILFVDMIQQKILLLDKQAKCRDFFTMPGISPDSFSAMEFPLTRFCLAQQRIYACGWDNAEIYEISLAGEPLRTIPMPLPRRCWSGIAASAQGDIYLANYYYAEVCQLSAAGRLHFRFQLPANSGLPSQFLRLQFFPDEHSLLLCDYGLRRLWKMAIP